MVYQLDKLCRFELLYSNTVFCCSRWHMCDIVHYTNMVYQLDKSCRFELWYPNTVFCYLLLCMCDIGYYTSMVYQSGNDTLVLFQSALDLQGKLCKSLLNTFDFRRKSSCLGIRICHFYKWVLLKGRKYKILYSHPISVFRLGKLHKILYLHSIQAFRLSKIHRFVVLNYKQVWALRNRFRLCKPRILCHPK